MFKKTTICPNPKNLKDNTCKGVRENGVLKNACATCTLYKNFVAATVPGRK